MVSSPRLNPLNRANTVEKIDFSMAIYSERKIPGSIKPDDAAAELKTVDRWRSRPGKGKGEITAVNPEQYRSRESTLEIETEPPAINLGLFVFNEDAMSDFFHGWRRKAGCVLLVLACALLSGWLRSLVRVDVIRTPYCLLSSGAGTMVLNFSSRTTWGWHASAMTPVNAWWVWFGSFGWLGDGFGVPYCACTVPLAPLSAYLILWNPRKPNQNATVIQSPQE